MKWPQLIVAYQRTRSVKWPRIVWGMAEDAPPPRLPQSQQQSGNLVPPRQDYLLSQASGGRWEAGGAVMQVNRMMVVYGFGLQGARLCVWLCNDREEAFCSLWMLPARPQPALKGKRLGRVASNHHQIGLTHSITGTYPTPETACQ